MVNYMHNEYDPYYKNQIKISGSEKILYEKKYDLKNFYNNTLIDNSDYSFAFNRNCEITGDMHDRHKVRWLKQLLIKKIYLLSSSFNNSSPYYVNIFMHSFLLFFSFLLINKCFSYNRNYNFLYLLYITFIFQQHLGEYSYSIFEMFFLSLALFASKQKNKILFLFTCLMAVLNRESGFIIALTWLIFNHKEIKTFLFVLILCSITFISVNFDLLECIIKPNYFIQLKYQESQINFTDILNANIFSIAKLILINFLLPFGLFFYFYINTEQKNKFLLYIILIYLITFLIATPAHHVAVRLVLLPLIFVALHFKENNKIKY